MQKEANRLLAVINPVSGGSDKKSHVRQLKKTCAKQSTEYYSFTTTGENDTMKLADVFDNILPEIVVVFGGDGTLNMVATALIDEEYTCALIPMGSANGLATELCINTPEEALDLVFQGKLIYMDMLKINDEYCLHFSDIGFNAELVKRYEKGALRGQMGYAKYLIEVLFSRVIFQCEFPDSISLDRNKKIKMVAIANARRFGSGAFINPKGAVNDGTFELVVVQQYPWYQFFRLSYLMFNGRLDELDFVKIFPVRQVRIKVNEKVPLQIDGESKGNVGEVLEATISSKKLKILVPQDGDY